MARLRYLIGAVVLCAVVAGGVVIAQTSGSDNEPRAEPRTSNTVPPNDDVPAACRELIVTPAERAVADDLTLGSANVVTMSDPDRAGAVTVSGGLIASVGETTSAAVDLEGATVLPGFIDSHSHWLGDSDMVGNTKPMAIAAALAAGWTSISEMFVSDERLEELCALELAGDLRVKVGAFLPVNYQLQRFGHPYEAFEPGQVLGSTLFLQGVKLFTDGADDGLGYQTKPPNPAVQGTLFWKGDDLANEIVAADQAGWQVAVHATGDAGLDALLEAYEQLGREAILEGRHRIEHLTTVRDDQVGRIAALGLIASIQHSWFHGDTAETLTRWVGRDRVSFTGRWRDFVDAGIPLTGGTDHPWSIAGEVGDSIAAIAHATTRVGTSGKPPPAWMASQRLTVWEVLRSLTVDAAYAQGTEESMGTIEVGKAGDLVILSADPTQVPPGELASIKVLATIVDGHVEYCADTVPDDLRPRCPA